MLLAFALLGGFYAIMMNTVVRAILIQNCLLVLLVSSLTRASENDINCMRTIKSQLKDPHGYLAGWGHFSQDGMGFSRGTSNDRVLDINLQGFGLEGEFPRGVTECSSLTSLNLSGNKLFGPLPPDIFSFLPYLVTLDLSNNNFSGEIPPTWSNIAYLNFLLLDHNQLNGHIPPGLALNPRLKQFSVSHNLLQGQIPEFTNGNTSLSSFEDNPGLCGFPLDPCSDPISSLSDPLFSVAVLIAASAAAAFFPLGAAIGWFCIPLGQKQKQRPRRC